jgi:hypothetical protein
MKGFIKASRVLTRDEARNLPKQLANIKAYLGDVQSGNWRMPQHFKPEQPK